MDDSLRSTPVIQDDHTFNEAMSLWHWLVVIGTALGTILTGLLPHSFGTLIANFQLIPNPLNGSISNQLSSNATQFQLNWLPALSSSIPCLLLPIFVLAVQKINRSYQMFSVIGFLFLSISCGLSSLVTSWGVLFFTYSFLYSLGSSLFLAIVVIILSEYFPEEHKFHVFATSLYPIGYPFAALVGNPLLAVLIEKYGWQTALKCASFFELICGIAIAMMMKPLREKFLCRYNNVKPDDYQQHFDNYGFHQGRRTFSTTSLNYFVNSYAMWPWLIGKFFNYMCWYGLRTNIVTYLVKSTSFGLEKAASLMATYAGAEVLVAIIASAFGDNFRGRLIHIHIISTSILSILTGIFTVTITSYLSAMILMICIGLSVQFSLSLGYPASVEVMENRFDMKTGWIFTNVAAGIGIFMSPLISGIMMDKYGVSSLFYAQCVGWILQTVLFIITFIVMKMSKNPNYEEIEQSN